MSYQLVSEYIDHSAETFADKVAFTDSDREYTFSQVRDGAAKIATAILSAGPRKEPVGIYLGRNITGILAMMGVVYSGNFYTVIDTDMPVARISRIMSVLEPKVIITDEEHQEAAKEFTGDAKIITLEEALSLQEDADLLAEARKKQKPEDVLYVLFTSGSTGMPKGAVISQKGVIAYMDWIPKALPIDENTVFALQSPLYFIMSGFEIYSTIRNGCTCHMIPKRIFSFPVMLLNWMNEKHITAVNWVPSILCLIANFRALPEVHLNDLKTVMFGGEVMPSKQLNMWIKEYPDVAFINMYGPTELTDIVSIYEVDRKIDDSESLPIGKPADYMQVMILDENDKEVPYGEEGELCATGPNMAYGYYRDPERTDSVFVKNPLDPTGQTKIYRTGDLVKFAEDGNMIYIGRKDFQIKHMGNRIELGEIEAAVTSLDGLERGCCLYDTKRSKIVLFYSGTITEDEIDEKLRDMLPEYMIPNRIEHLDVMPFNLNGKIDRAKLKEEI